MRFSKLIKQKSILLVPFSWMYKAGVFVYHKIFDLQIRKSYQPKVPVICVGNLSVGGTGKSPMVEYLLSILKDTFQVAVISRGYRRKTKGFLIANDNTTSAEIGDEPMQFHTKFTDVVVAVGEQRANAIQQLLQQKSATHVIILDDAYQHRQVSAGFNILLTEYNNLFTDDWYLPAGSLRDLKSNYKKADVIVVTKTDKYISTSQKQTIIEKIQPLSHQKIFFTAVDYGTAYNIFNKETIDLNFVEAIVLVTGIANPSPLLQYLQQLGIDMQHLAYADHHHFSQKDIGNILETYQAISFVNKIILTTEKDAMRLKERKELQTLPMFALPIKHQFLFQEEEAFNGLVLDFVNRGK